MNALLANPTKDRGRLAIALTELKHHIVEYTREIGADLIVLGTRGRTNLRYVMAGSTAERLLRELPCSVLAVHALETESGGKPALVAEPISRTRTFADIMSPAL